MCAAALVVAAAALFAQTSPSQTPPSQTPPSQTPPAQPQPPDMPTPRFRTEADVVVVEATVLDRKGAIVSGLGPADFKVEIGGKPREIVSVDLVEYAPPSTDAATAAGDSEITTNEPKENGRVVLLVIDQASLASDARAVIESAQKWVRSMPAKDLIGLLTFPAPGPSVDFTADHAKVAEALGKCGRRRLDGAAVPAVQHQHLGSDPHGRPGPVRPQRRRRARMPGQPAALSDRSRDAGQDDDPGRAGAHRSRCCARCGPRCAAWPSCPGRSMPCCCRPAGR